MTKNHPGQSRHFSVVVIGAGAAGIVAAISTKRKGNTVLMCDHMPAIGKKILASGNGRCNICNEILDESFYNPPAKNLVKTIFSRFGKKDILTFFKNLGLPVYSKENRIFPVTNQAASVLKVLEIELKRLAVPIKVSAEIKSITAEKKGFTLCTQDAQYTCDNIILAGGGKTYPALGADGSCYTYAKQFGHHIIEPIPSAVSLLIKHPLCHALQGQKISAKATALIDDTAASCAPGELLFTNSGLSGTAILDISDEISSALHRAKNKNVLAEIDLIPFMSHDELHKELKKRVAQGTPASELLIGLLPNKFCPALKDLFKNTDLAYAVRQLKHMRFHVAGTRGWNEAEFTNGGVHIQEINTHTLESKLQKGLYFAGEIVDVHGKRGGYNLAWAWASGFIAGLLE